MVTKTGQRGRPTKPAKQGEKTTLSLRVTPELKRRLDNVSTLSGRNLSQEAELRLEKSFHEHELMTNVLGFAYGPRIAGLVLVLARVMHDAGRQCEGLLQGSGASDQDWHAIPEAFDKVAQTVSDTLAALRPDADPSETEEITAEVARRLSAPGVGSGPANTILRAIAGKGPESLVELAGRWAELLGPLAKNVKIIPEAPVASEGIDHG